METGLFVDTASPWFLVGSAALFYVIVVVRYLILSAGYHLVVSRVAINTPRNFSRSSASQRKAEIRRAILCAGIFTVLSVLTYLAYREGYTRIYTDINEYSIGYFVFSVAALLVLYETYYYWLHRWMHKPSIYRIVHKAHHDSIHTSAFTSFSFHPIEAVLQFIFIPIIVMILPLHLYAIGSVLLLMTVSAVINHAGFEIFPRGFHKHPVGKWLIGATHHDLHHKEFRTNFGLYFTFWDRWMKTESGEYEKTFVSRTAPKDSVSQSQSPRRQSTDGLHT